MPVTKQLFGKDHWMVGLKFRLEKGGSRIITALAIDWKEGLPAPDAVLELMSCSCTHVCKAPQCKCFANGPRCTEMCRLTSCSNMQPDEEPEAVVDNEDDFDCESDGEDERY